MSHNDTSTPSPVVSWGSIETFARGKVQEFLQHILEEEVTALLGRERSVRRTAVDAVPGYRCAFRRIRTLSPEFSNTLGRRPR